MRNALERQPGAMVVSVQAFACPPAPWSPCITSCFVSFACVMRGENTPVTRAYEQFSPQDEEKSKGTRAEAASTLRDSVKPVPYFKIFSFCTVRRRGHVGALSCSLGPVVLRAAVGTAGLSSPGCRRLARYSCARSRSSG